MSQEAESTITQMQSVLAEHNYVAFVELSDKLDGKTVDPNDSERGYGLGRGNPFVWKEVWDRLNIFRRFDITLDGKKLLISSEIEKAARFGMLEEAPFRNGARVIAENYQLEDRIKNLIPLEPASKPVADAATQEKQPDPLEELAERIVRSISYAEYGQSASHPVVPPEVVSEPPAKPPDTIPVQPGSTQEALEGIRAEQLGAQKQKAEEDERIRDQQSRRGLFRIFNLLRRKPGK